MKKYIIPISITIIMFVIANVILNSCKKRELVGSLRIPVTGVTLNMETLTLGVTGTITLIATVQPDSASNKNVIWTSSNSNIATVTDNGTVTAKAVGTSTITVKTEDGDFTKNCIVTVSADGPIPPVLTTLNATDITSTSAVLGGNITNVGNPAYTERGVCYSTSENPTVSDKKIAVSGSGAGNFSKSVSNLTASTNYYFRAYAINTNGTAYGEQKSFKTNTPNPYEIEMVFVEGGTFTMGDPTGQEGDNPWSKPVHQVTLSSFNISKYQITQSQWIAVMGSWNSLQISRISLFCARQLLSSRCSHMPSIAEISKPS